MLEEFIGLGEIDDCLFYVLKLCHRTLMYHGGLLHCVERSLILVGRVSADEKCSMF